MLRTALLSCVALLSACGDNDNVNMPAHCARTNVPARLTVKVANDFAAGKVMGLGDCRGFTCTKPSALGCHEWVGEISPGVASRCQVALFMPTGETASWDVQGGAFCGPYDEREITLAP